jgi:hypothetical protein
MSLVKMIMNCRILQCHLYTFPVSCTASKIVQMQDKKLEVLADFTLQPINRRRLAYKQYDVPTGKANKNEANNCDDEGDCYCRFFAQMRIVTAFIEDGVTRYSRRFDFVVCSSRERCEEWVHRVTEYVHRC